MLWNIDFEVSAAIILTIIAIYLFTSKRMVTNQNRIYSVMLILSLIGVGTSILQQFMIQHLMEFSLLAHQMIAFTYFSLRTVVYFFLFYYIQLVSVNQFAKNRFLNGMQYVPMAACLLFLVSSFVWEIPFLVNYDQGLVYHWSMVLVYVVWTCYVCFGYAQVIRSEAKMQFHQRLAFHLSLLFIGISFVLQMLLPGIRLGSLSNALMLLLFYFVIENPKLSTDDLTGLFNRSALLNRLHSDIKHKEPFHIITIAMDDFRFINETYGYHYGDLLLKAIGKKLLETSSAVYRYMGDTFCIVVNDEASIMHTINRIKSKLDAPWNINSTVCLLSASFCIVSFPDNAQTTNELLDFIDYTIHEAKKVSKGAITYGKNSSKEKILRNNAIEYLLKEAIQYDRFDVHYQPIYHYQESRFVAAEALIRLYDKELGYISPVEFIPIAEKNGSILKIGLIVFEKVCQFLEEYQPSQYGIEYIEVNLSVLQCMQRRLSQEMIDIMKKYKIDPSQINFELTESAVAESKGMLETTMKELIAYGCNFSLDDFGTGFSNISYVTQLPFEIVKIDKGLIWASMGSKKAKIAITHLVSMFKQMDMKIVAEGIETQEQLELLVGMDCDFIQGYYYSKPIEGAAFLKLIQNKAMA